jgi:hypothetical protein
MSRASVWIVCGKRQSGKKTYTLSVLNKELPEQTCIFVLSDRETTQDKWHLLAKESKVPIAVASPSEVVVRYLVKRQDICIVLDGLSKNQTPGFWSLLDEFARQSNSTTPKLVFLTQSLKQVAIESCDVVVCVGKVSTHNKARLEKWATPQEVRWVKAWNVGQEQSESDSEEDVE